MRVFTVVCIHKLLCVKVYTLKIISVRIPNFISVIFKNSVLSEIILTILQEP
jgi:hypothetical protein